jgi:hypothetical protein
MTGKRFLLQSFRKFDHDIEITLGDNSKISATGEGTVFLTSDLSISALFVPNLTLSLISVRQLLQDINGSLILNCNGGFLLSKAMKKIVDVQKQGNIYTIDVALKTNQYALTSQNLTSKMWHMKLGHISSASLKKILGSVDGSEEHCETCMVGKSTQKPFKRRSEYSSRLLERIHVDIIGPLPLGLNGEKYVGVFIEEKRTGF